MKNLLLIILLFGSPLLPVSAQVKYSKTDSMVIRAWRHLQNPKVYNPQAAFTLYEQAATQGHPKAMNELARLYQKGLGTPINQQAAFSWFERAANAGYSDAWGYLGLFYKNGNIVPQEFKEAYNCFARGHVAGSPFSTYLLGFMTYKGLGCKQDYQTAVKLFREASAKGNLDARYMLGLCYRNGYGVKLNIDSAKNLLENAARLGNKLAKEELSIAEPEYKAGKEPKAETLKAVPTGAQKLEIKRGKMIKADDLNGDYSGYIIKYDWSGKRIIGQSKLELHLDGRGSNISGEWLEDGSAAALLNATLTDSGLVFNNTSYERDEHYSPSKPVNFEFRDASFQLAKHGNEVYISGKLQLYSLKLHEPEKPIYVFLTKDRVDKGRQTLALKPEEQLVLQSASKGFMVYPNPFSNSFNLNYTQSNAGRVQMQLFDTQGKLLLQQEWNQEAGTYNKAIDASFLQTGSYLVKLTTSKTTYTSLVIKY